MTQTPWQEDARHAAEPVPAENDVTSILPWVENHAPDGSVTRTRRQGNGGAAIPAISSTPAGGTAQLPRTPLPGTDAGPVAAGVVDDADADLFDDSWTAPQRVNRLGMVLAAGVVAALAFAGGTYAQRQHDQGLTSSATGTARTGGFGGAFPGGALPSGFAGFGGGNGAGAASGAGGAGAGNGNSAGNGTGSGASTGAPVVVGTVSALDASSVTVKNFGGQSVVVHVSPTTTVTVIGLGGLKVGAVVSVVGTKGADGSVSATAIVSRRAS